MGRAAALLAAVAGAVLVTVLLALPFGTKDRVLPAAIPQPTPLFSTPVVSVPGGKAACMRPATVDEHSEVANIKVGTRRRPAVPIRFTIRGDGYRATAGVPATYADNDTVPIPVEPPAEPERVRICVANEGERVIDLYAADDRTRTRAETFVGGRRVAPNFDLWFTEREPASFADRAGTIAERIATFRPGGPWLPWLIGILVLAAVPLALVVAIVRAAGADPAQPD